MKNQTKQLIAYFSRKGENYFNGAITRLPVGNTEIIAKKLRKCTGADLFQIVPAVSYPEAYEQTVKAAKKELEQDARPPLLSTVENMASYDAVYLGYPNWCGTMPMPVFTFLDSYDFFGKTIIPFCTHEGSGLAKSEADIKKLCPGAIVLPGVAIRGKEIGANEDTLLQWFQGRIQ